MIKIYKTTADNKEKRRTRGNEVSQQDAAQNIFICAN